MTRVIRDISSDDIVAGNKLTNFRQIAEAELSRRGGRCVDIRSREIRRDAIDARDLSDRETRYATSVGEECFLETVTSDDRIVGFLRLSLPDRAGRVDRPAELADSAIIREVHVYGASLELGRIPGGLAQHRGIGGRLVDAAVDRARAAGYEDLAVISSVGTRPWYRRLGFRDGALYQHRPLG